MKLKLRKKLENDSNTHKNEKFDSLTFVNICSPVYLKKMIEIIKGNCTKFRLDHRKSSCFLENYY